MAYSIGKRTGIALILALALTAGSLIVFGDDGHLADALVPISSPTTVVAGETFIFTIEPHDEDLVLEARFPGVLKNWLFEPEEKGDLATSFELQAPFAGTNISLRIASWNEVDGQKVPESEMEWITINVTGWTDEDDDGRILREAHRPTPFCQ